MQTNRICPECRRPLADDAPQGLCPQCLVKAGLGSGANVGAQTESGQPHFVAPRPEELTGRFPQLEIISFVGQGGMGAVYKARQKQLDRIVALKILPPGIGEDPQFAQRFAREAKALAKLDHPGIVTIHDFGQADGLFFFVMEFVDGVNLRQLLQSRRISPREALAIVPQICDALQYAHDKGIVHRDIKPENILLDRRGRVKVADFGLAKLVGCGNELASESREATPSAALTEAGKIIGTPNYIAPEQMAHPGEVDHRTDIYSLGVVFYEMLTGELPLGKFVAPSQKVLIDVRLDEVVLKALENEPDRRYQRASDVKAEVDTLAATRPQSASNSPDNKPASASEADLQNPKSCNYKGPEVERNIILPIKAVLLMILLLRAGVLLDQAAALELSPQKAGFVFWVYVAINSITAAVLLASRRLPPRLVQCSILITCLVDNCCLAVLTVFTGGWASPLYWLFIGMIVRGAAVESRTSVQLFINLAASAAYLGAGYLDTVIFRLTSPTDQRVIELYATDSSEQWLARFLLLILITVCCWSLRTLLRRSHTRSDRRLNGAFGH